MVAGNKRDVERLQRANRATACLLRDLVRRAQPGITTGALNDYAMGYIHRIGGEPVFHTQNGFPGAINTSINDEAVHGVPGDRVLEDGDLLKIDCGIRLHGFCGDTTMTVIVGSGQGVPAERRAVRDAAVEALRRGIAAVRVGGHVGDLGEAMQAYVEARGLRLLSQFTGHGLGRRLWEPPLVPSVGRAGTGPAIVDGMVFTIEPIVTSGDGRIVVDADGWTVRTIDRAPVAQFEHTVIATKQGARVLSLCPA